MRKLIIAGLVATTAISGVLPSVAAAQPGHGHGHHQDHDWDRWDRDADHSRHDHGYRYWGRGYGYAGYRGHWRTGQQYPHWRNHGYVIEDWRVYDLPPPPPGYRYYRDDSGDIVMAAIASGVIGLIIGGALADHH